MKKFLKDTKGAVTVFITLLLIPAMLISGTAVDLARIHTAHSTIQNANQLAANTVMTQYNALLYDIYGLMAVAKDDQILYALLDEYIKVTVFGGQWADRTIGTLQVFYGADIALDEPYFPEGKNLRNPDVLRRQIEQYMKFRGPILLVQEFLDRLTENRILNDAQIINDKVTIDSAIADIFEKYKELYNAIIAADRCTHAIGGIAGGSFGFMSTLLTIIHEDFVMLRSLANAYMNSTCPIEQDYYSAIYDTVRRNIRAVLVGGSRHGFTANGGWDVTGNINRTLPQAIENARQQAEDFKPRFDLVVTLARQLDEMKAELANKINDFEQKLYSGEISEELRIAFSEQVGSPPKSIIERYRNILKWDIEPMADVYRDGGYSYIDDIHKPMLEDVRFRNRLAPGAQSLSQAELTNLPNDSRFGISSGGAAHFANIPRDNVTYKMEPGFLRFAEHPGNNAAFFAELSEMMNQPELPPIKLFDGQEDASGANAEQIQRNLINDLLNIVNTAYNGLENEPLGAKYINNATTSTNQPVNMLDVSELIPEATSMSVLNIIQDPLSSLALVGDYMLLLIYCASMFSNYATAKPETIGQTRNEFDATNLARAASGVPMSPEVNYFYQSELEYLFHGSENAETNLSAVTRLLLLVRLICNYIRVFSVSEVTAVVSSIKTAFAWAPPLALILGELARAAFVAAESVIDVAALRSGHRVSLLKNISAGEWVSTPSGLLKATTNMLRGEHADGSVFGNERGLTYMNYMLFFFVAKAVFYTGSYGNAANELAVRTANLIEWNIVNFESGSNADEGNMAEAMNCPNRFRLEDMKTDFSLTTTASLRMLFLSMAFARNFSDSRGIGIPPAMQLRVTDYRGY
ncbi:MAG: DUF5702 domain-containing protein [Oscillospiraceae bacterium]|nr:DUF5702 domain-containing protein [Oscillospiraceae bacterium]